MVRNYYGFVNEADEAEAKPKAKKMKKPTRADLAVGRMVKTAGIWDNVDLTGQLGNIIQMGEYGNLLIQFLAKFDPKLHAGHKNRGADKQCLYVPLDNIAELISEELATDIINKNVVPYRASKDLLRIFRKMKFEPKEEYLDVSYFDIDKANMDVLTYLPAKKFEGDPDTKKGRQAMKVGRVLRKLDDKLTDKDVEDMVVSYRAAFKVIVLGEGKNLDVVTGEDIRYWYCNEHYAPIGKGGSELWNSCMSGPQCARYFTIYVENPDRIALCIYTNEDDKLLARALVWRIDDGRVYMDRIYAVNPAEKKILQDYAKKNGMCSYQAGNAGKLKIHLPKDYGGKDRPKDGNPYFDTMRHFGKDKNGPYIGNGYD